MFSALGLIVFEYERNKGHDGSHPMWENKGEGLTHLTPCGWQMGISGGEVGESGPAIAGVSQESLEKHQIVAALRRGRGEGKFHVTLWSGCVPLKGSSTKEGSYKGCMFLWTDSITDPSPITYLPTETLKSSIRWDQGGKTKDPFTSICHQILLTLPSGEIPGHSPDFHFIAAALIQTLSFPSWTREIIFSLVSSSQDYPSPFLYL